MLSLNLTKTVYMVFTKRKIREMNLLLQNSKIPSATEIKFLGVIINSGLSWNQHIVAVCEKMSKVVGIIAKIRHIIPTENVRLLYKALVEPYMNYCCIIWASSDRSCLLDRVLKIQKKFCRLITFSHFQASSAPLFKNLNLLTIYNLYKYQALVYMYKHSNNLLPRSMYRFSVNSEVHSHLTRQYNKIHRVYCRTKLYQMTLGHQGPKLWNCLPDDLKMYPLKIFQLQLKSYLLDA